MNKIEQIFSSTTEYQKSLLKKLLEHGLELDLLHETDVVTAGKDGKFLFFIDEYTPLMPHNIGLILTNRDLIYYLLNHFGINFAHCFAYKNSEALTAEADSFFYPVALGWEDFYYPLWHKVIESSEELRRSMTQGEIPASSIIVNRNSSWRNKLAIFIDGRGFCNVLSGHDEVLDVTMKTHESIHKLASDVLRCFPGLTQISFILNVNDFSVDIGKNYEVETLCVTPGFHYSSLAIGEVKENVLNITANNILRLYSS